MDKKEMLLLGAGASVEAGVPDAVKMTTAMLNEFERVADEKGNAQEQCCYEILKTVIERLKENSNIPNVEEVFNVIALLLRRKQIEAAPFIKGWIDEVDAIDEKKTGFTSQTPLQLTQGRMLQALARLVYIDEGTKVDYLSPIFRNPNLRVIATLNYDNSIELAANKNGFDVIDGLDEWLANDEIVPNDPNRWEPQTIYLLKLHGSVLWRRLKGNYPFIKPFTEEFHYRAQEIDIKTGQPHYNPGVIFGGSNKLTANGPFLDLLREFQTQLRQCKLLTVIGYSCADEHINILIARWLNSSDDTVLRIVNPKFKMTPITSPRSFKFSRANEFIYEVTRFGSKFPNRLIINELPKLLSDVDYDDQIRTFTADTLKQLYPT